MLSELRLWDAIRHGKLFGKELLQLVIQKQNCIILTLIIMQKDLVCSLGQ